MTLAGHSACPRPPYDAGYLAIFPHQKHVAHEIARSVPVAQHAEARKAGPRELRRGLNMQLGNSPGAAGP